MSLLAIEGTNGAPIERTNGESIERADGGSVKRANRGSCTRWEFDELWNRVSIERADGGSCVKRGFDRDKKELDKLWAYDLCLVREWAALVENEIGVVWFDVFRFRLDGEKVGVVWFDMLCLSLVGEVPCIIVGFGANNSS